jgi:Tol biopolymer transport system component
MGSGYPSWSQDGKSIYFLSSPAGQRGIWRVQLAGRKAEKVASLEEVDRPTTIFGTWVGLAPDDSPLALRNLTTEDIYAWTFVTIQR